MDAVIFFSVMVGLMYFAGKLVRFGGKLSVPKRYAEIELSDGKIIFAEILPPTTRGRQ